MASTNKNSARSRYWTACVTGPDKKQIQFSTKHEDREHAQDIADLLEKAARLARNGLLNPEKINSLFEILPPMDPDVRDKTRFYLNSFLAFSGADTVSETTTRSWCES